MARRKEKPLIVYSCVLMPDGTKVRTTDLPPEVWAEKRKELAKRFTEAYARALENNPHDMKLIYENPERYGATIYPL